MPCLFLCTEWFFMRPGDLLPPHTGDSTVLWFYPHKANCDWMGGLPAATHPYPLFYPRVTMTGHGPRCCT